jgi:hypothetical protein
LSSLNTEPIGNNAEENTLFFSGGSNTFIWSSLVDSKSSG